MLKSVDGRNVQGQSIRELRSCLPGPLGTVVNLGFDGEQGPYDVGVFMHDFDGCYWTVMRFAGKMSMTKLNSA